MKESEKQWVLDGEIRYIFLCDLALGSALVNSTNGYVYLDNNYIIKNNLEGFILNKIPQESFN